MNKNAKTAAKGRRQVGALPYKVVDDSGVEVMLVTSRETKRWIIPKGWPMKDRKPHMAAKREAFEEAGVRGQIGKRPIGTFVYDKRPEVAGHRLLQGRGLPAEGAQAGRGMARARRARGALVFPDEAAKIVKEAELREIIRKLPELVEAKTPSAPAALSPVTPALSSSRGSR